MSSSVTVLSMLIILELDLQIKVCTFLHPSDILALRMTCKVLQIATKQRIIWVDALHRVCLQNSLFLPSFPIPDMSNMELERAAMAPHRWIKRCAAFSKQHSLDSDAALCPVTTRITQNPLAGDDPSIIAQQLFLVPGGRYLVSLVKDGMAVLDLGHTPNADCRLLASVVLKDAAPFFLVHPTSDGTGLTIVIFPRYERCSVYEIYPQSESPQLTHVAQLDVAPQRYPQAHLLPNKVIWHSFHEGRIIFRVWDYRLNHSVCFCGNIDVGELDFAPKLIAIDTRIIIIFSKDILAWDIPPLLPQPPDFSDQNPTHIPSLFQISFPDDFVRNNKLYKWETTSNWYSGASQPLYFNAICQDLKLQDFELVIKPDLSDVSLHLKNACQLPLFDPNQNPLVELEDIYFRTDSICEDKLVSFWDVVVPNQCRVHIRSPLSHPGNVVSPESPIVLNILLSGTDWGQRPWLCPASGRVVHTNQGGNKIAVLDFLP